MVLLNELINLLKLGQSRKMVDDVIVWTGNHRTRFSLLLNVIKSNQEQIMRDRAAWALSYIAVSHPELLKPHWNEIMKLLTNINSSSPVRRNLTRFLQFVDIPVKYHGVVMHRCFELMNDPGQDIAIRVFSMTVLYNFCLIYPAISNELKLSIQEMIPHASAGTLNRAQKILKKMENQH